MMHPTRAGIGLVRMGNSNFVPANPEEDVRGKDVYDAQGQRIGSVGDLYIDRQEREVRFLEVGAGGFLGTGEKRFLIPVEAVTQVAEGGRAHPLRHQSCAPARRRPERGLRLASVRQRREPC